MGGGGPAKAAAPVVTPFVEPAAPKNPIPNWFAGHQAGQAFTPDFNNAARAFGTVNPPTPTQMQSAAPQSPQMPQMPQMQQMTQTPLTSAEQNQGNMMRFAIPTQPQMARPDIWQRLQQLGQGDGFRSLWDAIQPSTYSNYTDTTPGLSTDARGKYIRGQ